LKYTVYIMAVVRVKRTDIEADSQVEAIKKAEESTDFDDLFGNRRGDDEDLTTEYAEGIDSFLVDEEGDTEHERSAWYDKQYAPL